jgi:hypothetical protein
VPTIPENEQPVTVTTPWTALSEEQPERVPLLADKLMEAEKEVSMVPSVLSTLSTGCVASALPDADAAGWVVKTSEGGVALTLKLLLTTDGSDPSTAVSV